jgi:hypothetical protein
VKKEISSSWIDELKQVVKISDSVEEKLQVLDRIEKTLTFIYDKYLYCGEECEGPPRFIDDLKHWLELYTCIAMREPSEILDRCVEKAGVDWKTMVIYKICVKPFECIDINERLPLDNDAKQSIMMSIKNKIMQLVDDVHNAYAETLIALVRLVREVIDDVEDLKSKYKDLHDEMIRLTRHIMNS